MILPRAVMVALCALTWSMTARAQPRVVIDATQDRGAVRRDVFGGDLEFINADLPAVRALAAELPLLRFPGGDADATFRWDQSLTPRCMRAGFDWEAAAAVALRGGAGMFLETNLVRSTPENAAMWVQDATRRGIRVAWVGIGNEPWGDWDAGYRTAARYAADVIAHATAIRARVPGARIVLAIGTSAEEAWSREAIRRAASVIDAVDYHYYPNHDPWTDMDPAEVVAGAEGIAPLVSRIRTMIREEAGSRASAIQVVFGEWDGAADAPRVQKMDQLVTPRAYAMWAMADALFYGSAVGELLSSEVAAAMFYEVQGFRFGAIPGDWCVDSDTSIRRPKALVHQLWREHFGDRLIAVTPTGVPTYTVTGPTRWDGYRGVVPYARAYASLGDGGRALRVIVTHRGATNVSALRVELQGFEPEARASVWEVGGGGILDTNENVRGPTDVVRIRTRAMDVSGQTFTLPLAPYSVTAIELRRRETTTPDAGSVADVVVRDVVLDDVRDVPLVRPDVLMGDVPMRDVPMVDVPTGDDVVANLDGARDDAGAEPGPPPASAGCGCAVPRAASRGPLALMALAWAVRRRRRR